MQTGSGQPDALPPSSAACVEREAPGRGEGGRDAAKLRNGGVCLPLAASDRQLHAMIFAGDVPGGHDSEMMSGAVYTSAVMVAAVLFDLFETLITESRTRPPGVSSLAPALGCEREAFRRHWKALRPAVMIGRLSFRQALSDIATGLGRPAEDLPLRELCEERVRRKAEPFEQIEHDVLIMIDCLRSRGIRLGVVSNCFAEDVAAWPHSSLAPRFDCTVFSFEVGLAKPDPEIYREAARRLQADVSHTWFVGDGGHEELSGAEQAGLRPFRATWFLRRWPHFREEPGSVANVATAGEIVSLVARAIGP